MRKNPAALSITPALKYITPRGDWYHQSWKGNIKQSGGIETNIGIHFFDMLIWIFGKVDSYSVLSRSDKTSVGMLYLKNAEVHWELSIDKNRLPDKDLKFFRSIIVEGEEIRFDNIIGEFHTLSYTKILEGNGFTIEDVKPSIELVTKLRG